ncbi:hypothetical protein JD292_07670 [Leucobacter sp. CSA2]|uniref:SDR-like Ig domain-containing protein n=1 Tax=Leucobacter edaphi TaxID=2796472 RepID=A0A934UYC6_9MICO|nr:Ig-like domain-containing protein [Leucobacter edaphi]MBK0421952.1 hypothetical protein [Leucobacter edaphi]
MNHPRTPHARGAQPSRIRRFAAGMLGISLVGGGLFFGGGAAAPAEAAAYSPTCAAELTSAAITPSEDLTLTGRVLESWLKPDWEFDNMNQAAQRGQSNFDIKVAPEAKAGDTYTLHVDGIGTFAGTPRDLVNKADGAVIATAKMIGSTGVEFTFTDYVNTHKDVTGTYEQSYGYSSVYAPGGVLQPGQVYTTTFSGCENGVSTSFDTTTPEQYNTTGLRSSWRGTQDEAKLAVVYNGQPAASATDLTTVSLTIDRPGTKWDCTQLENQTSPFGIGYGIWGGKFMTDAKLSTQTTAAPKPGEYRIVSCTDREIKIEWMPQAAGETFRAQLQTIPDGTSQWEALGRNPFTIGAHEESLEHGAIDRSAVPTRPFTDGSAAGDLNYVDPVITKVRAADGSFELTVTNPTTDGVVKAQSYTDALYNAAGVLSADQRAFDGHRVEQRVEAADARARRDGDGEGRVRRVDDPRWRQDHEPLRH